MPRGPLRAQFVSRPAHPARRRRAPKRHHPVRKRPDDERARSQLQSPRVGNLYVVDASFFPSSGAVNPGLTIIANALRVGDHLLERMNAERSDEKVMTAVA